MSGNSVSDFHTVMRAFIVLMNQFELNVHDSPGRADSGPGVQYRCCVMLTVV
jgi:hypothetical protein